VVATTPGSATLRRLAAPLGLAFAALLLFLLPSGASAAALTHVGAFGSANQPTFSGPAGIAVDQSTHQVYVINMANFEGTVSRWNEDGSPANFAALGTNVLDGKGNGSGPGSGGSCTPPSAECDETPRNGMLGNFEGPNEVQIAIDESNGPAAGDIYVTDSTSWVVDIFSAEGEYLGQLNEYKEGNAASGPLAPFGETCGVAVGPDGSVYVDDFNNGIHKYEPTANPVFNTENTANFTSVTNPCTLAVGGGPTAGSLFVNTFGAEVFKVDGSTGTSGYEVSGGNSTVNVDPATGHVYAAAGNKIIEWDASGASSATEVTNTTLAGLAAGIAIDEASGNVYVSVAGDPNVEVYSSASPAPEFPLTVTVTGEGQVTGQGIACTEAGNGGPECEEEFPEGAKVPLSETPAAGWEFAGWGGACSGTGACEVEITAAESVTAEFSPKQVVPRSLTVEVEGEGEVTGANPPIPLSGAINGCAEGAGQCSAEYADGTQVPLVATAGGSSHFVGWTTVEGTAGTCSGAAASCEAGPLAGPTKLKAIFAVSSTHPLVVFVTGEGEVSANAGPIAGCTAAGGATCEGEYEGSVTLTETPAAGSVFAGWVGCRHQSATSCQVTVSSEKEVYAVFLKEGVQGQPGPEGPAGQPGPGGSAGQPGPEGPEGPAGSEGIPGPSGTTGPAGAQGPAGSQGPAGAKGDTGASGAAGPVGPQGPAGPGAKVTCKVKQGSGKKVKVTCTVKYQSGKASGSSVQWRLMHAGRLVRQGRLEANGSSALSLTGLSPGRYRLHVAGRKGSQPIAVG